MEKGLEMTNYYDAEHKHKIECFYDPCYRTGDYYRVSEITTPTNAGEIADNLYYIFNRSEGSTIYFVDSAGKELRLKPIKLERFVSTNIVLLYFENEENGQVLVYDTDAHLIMVTDQNELKTALLNADLIGQGRAENYAGSLVSYSFVENYSAMDKEINPAHYADAEPWSDEEKEIVEKRITENPTYKCEEYGKEREDQKKLK